MHILHSGSNSNGSSHGDGEMGNVTKIEVVFELTCRCGSPVIVHAPMSGEITASTCKKCGTEHAIDARGSITYMTRDKNGAFGRVRIIDPSDEESF